MNPASTNPRQPKWPVLVLSGLLLCLVAITWNLLSPPVVKDHSTIAPRVTCQNQLRQLDSAKQQWASDNHQSSNAIPTQTDLMPYLQNHSFPLCPKGGTYTIGQVGTLPTCSIPGHVMPP
ncbi:MAG TPA: hypothetical protein VL527_16965 [Dongiaceae bacterium]|nr:hypothetical protein [Dongiaceae bacterium]